MVRNRATACAVAPHALGYEVQLEDGTKLIARNLFLATGHFCPKKRFADHAHPGWFSSPYPAKVLQRNIPIGADVGIAGSSLSAIDTALTLCVMNGRFETVDPHGTSVDNDNVSAIVTVISVESTHPCLLSCSNAHTHTKKHLPASHI